MQVHSDKKKEMVKLVYITIPVTSLDCKESTTADLGRILLQLKYFCFSGMVQAGTETVL